MAMSEKDQKLIEQYKAIERASLEPAIKPTKTPVEQAINQGAMAICGMIALVGVLAYSISPYAFWKAQDNEQAWCLDNGFNMFTKGTAACHSAYFLYRLNNDY